MRPSPTITLPAVTPDDLANGLLLLLPVLVVVVTATIALILDLAPPEWVSRRFLQWVSAFGLVVAIVYVAALAPLAQRSPRAFGGFLALDSFALFFEFLFLVAALLVILSANTFADRQESAEGEFYVIALFSTAGLMLMAQAAELISIYVSLELSSLGLAFLAASNKRDRLADQGRKSTEAGMKYLLLSAMSSAILLYGMALMYGISGATTLADIARAFSRDSTPAVILSMAMIIAGFGFKIAAAPFQLWTPDVYQGAPTPATAFFSVASKAAGFAVVLRVLNEALPGLTVEWTGVFGVLAFITMTVGNLVALVQTNIKRLMAYSSITHVGYLLVGIATASPFANSGILYYLLAYTFTNMAAFIVITIMARYVPDDSISGYVGLAKRAPILALGLTAALLSLAGIPPFVGFFAKLYLFLAAIERGNLGLQFLVVWAVIMSALSLYYYGRVIHAMWMREVEPAVAATQTEPLRTAFSQWVALAASLVGVLFTGLAAAPLLAAAQTAANTLTP
ncbi:MAG: NADH-quinone oxidoreductase subunit N [Chloroflexi bacterium]|nr:NADH-quinone oxidoreductase subunit N [Chloroflexota bacterium]